MTTDIKVSDSTLVRVYEDMHLFAIVDETGQVAAIKSNDIDGLIQALLTVKVIMHKEELMRFSGHPIKLDESLDSDTIEFRNGDTLVGKITNLDANS